MTGILAHFYDLTDSIHSRRKGGIQFHLITALALQDVSKIKVNSFDFNSTDAFRWDRQSHFPNGKVRPRITQLFNLPGFHNLFTGTCSSKKVHKKVPILFQDEFVELIATTR